MAQSQAQPSLDFSSHAYRDPFSRINAIVIEGEQEAYNNFICLANLLPEHTEELTQLGKMERGHSKGFESCGRNLDVVPDLEFAKQFFEDLRNAFQDAAVNHKIATCLLIQALVIECFAIAAYNNYIPVADDFARKITESVVADEYLHLNFGELWLKAHFEEVKEELEAANQQVLPIIWRMLNRVEADARGIGMNKQLLIEEFVVRYGEALSQIGFSTREVLRLSSKGLQTI
ncbi:MAG: aldehyde oxygenase (deformylating) [Phormidium sp.]